MIQVTILNPKETLFSGEAERIALPGDCGDFEVLPFHKPLISLLRKGRIVMDGGRQIAIKQGIVRVSEERVVALVEQ